MVVTYGHILYGYKIDEEKLSEVLGDDFEDFEEEYLSLFGDMVGEETPGWIPDQMRGEDAYFGIDIWCEDLDCQIDEPFEIPDHQPYLEQLNTWISSHNDLFKKILSCAEKPEPKMMFTVIYS
jgi:hypothetical protein